MTTATIRYKAPEVWMEVLDPKRIAKLMVIQGVSARAVARAAGWKSHTYMQRILKGDPAAKTVTPESAARIALFFGVGIDDLFVARTSTESEQIAKQRGRAA